METWKDVIGYEGYYQVSNLGNVKSLKSYGGRTERVLVPQRNGTGYLKVMLCKDGKHKQFLIHRLVATAFIENPNKYDFVNHKDENKQNNNVENLEWCTKSYNSSYYLNFDKSRKIEYASRLWKKKSPALERKPKKYTQKVVQKGITGDVIKVHNDTSQASIATGIDISGIIYTCKMNLKRTNNPTKKKYTSHGYIWEFVD